MNRQSVERAATIGTARRLLAKAAGELDEARTLDDQRQAAEKVWLSLVTAGRAVLRCAGDPSWQKTTAVADRVERTEAKKTGVTRLADHLRTAQGGIHGACFYAGDETSCDIAGLRAAARLATEQIDYAAGLCRIVKRGKR